MNNINPYEKYKYSGIAWLGEIPEHWEVIKLTGFCDFVRGNSSFQKDELLSNGKYVALQYGKTYKVNEVDGKYQFYVNDEFYKVSQIVNYGDVVFISTSETIEDLGHSVFYNRSDLGLLGGEQILLKPYKKIVNEKYLYYSSTVFAKDLKQYATGVKVFRFNINDLKTIYTSNPSLPEQTAIANFLDFKIAKIERFLRKKKQLIKLLNEKKAAIINKAVTKGINPNAKMKPSGIEWLGDIPEHWEVRKLKYSVKLNQHSSFNDIESSSTKIALENIESKTGRILELNPNSFEGVGTIFKCGDVLFGKLRPYLAKAATPEFEGSCVNEILVLTPNKYIWHNEFLKYRILAPDFISLVDNSTYGAKMPRASWNFIGSLKISCPSTIEQQSIVNRIEEEHKNLNELISKIEKEIALVEEYKTALIAEAVTGKIDVRDYEIPETTETESGEELEEEIYADEDYTQDYITGEAL